MIKTVITKAINTLISYQNKRILYMSAWDAILICLKSLTTAYNSIHSILGPKEGRDKDGLTSLKTESRFIQKEATTLLAF